MSIAPHKSPAQTIAIGLAKAISVVDMRQSVQALRLLRSVAIYEFEKVVISTKKRGCYTALY